MKLLGNILILFIFFTLAWSCETTSFKEIKVVDTPDLSDKYIIEKDSLFIQTEETFSENLRIIKFNDEYLLIDKRLVNIFVIDFTAGRLKKVLSRGNGPNEAPLTSIEFVIPEQESLTLIGGSYDYSKVNRNYERFSSSIIDWQKQKSTEALLKNPDPEASNQYNMPYGANEVFYVNKQQILFPMFSAPAPYMPPFNSKLPRFYKEAKLFALLDAENLVFEKMAGAYPNIFPAHRRDFAFFNYTKLSVSYLVSFLQDSLIYVYDENLNGLYGFGRRAKQMNDQYKEIENRNMEYYASEANKALFSLDFYQSIFAFDETGVICRTNGKMIEGNRLNMNIQLYKDRALIGEVSDMDLLGAYQDGKYYGTPSYDRDSKQLKFKYLTIEEK